MDDTLHIFFRAWSTPTLDIAVRWLLRQCGRPQTECRHACMKLSYQLCTLVPGKLRITHMPKYTLSLKAPITTAADDNLEYFSLFSEKIRLDVSSETSARQRIRMKNQALFSSKDKNKKLKCRLLQFLFGTVRINGHQNCISV